MSIGPAVNPTPCPDPDTLGRLLRAELTETVASTVEEHVNSCAGCQRALQSLVGSLPQTLAAMPTATSPDELPAIPGHEILGILGEGGMGVVYRARQSGLNREVALKTILRADASRTARARFWSEAEALAAVRHPNVVQVYETGVCAGRPFMAMELVTGGSLSDRLNDGQRMSQREAARLMEQIARGVGAAHELGIVHRDLKPGNVLLTEDGTPKVADFGLAKWRSTDLTRTQTLMGTPAYMAPEQAAGRAKFLGPQADVWALGVILYECISGERPFTGNTAEVLLTQIQTAEPDPLRKRVRGLSRDLDTIVAKCLAKEPERRYATATELADDLARFLRREPIAARPVGRAERLVRWARRKPTAAAAYGFSALAVMLALVTFVVVGLWREAERAKGVAEGAQKEADNARGVVQGLLNVEKGLRTQLESTNGQLKSLNANLQNTNGKLETANQQVQREREKLARFNYGQTIKAAYQAWRENKFAEARTLLARTRPDLRGWEYDYVHRLCHADALTLSHADLIPELGNIIPITNAVWSPDGSKALTSDEFNARLWDAATGTRVLHFRSPGAQLTALAWAPDGSKFFLADRDTTAQIRDAKTGKVLGALKGRKDEMGSAVWTADGARILTLGDRFSTDTTARVWNAVSGDLIAELKGHARPTLSAAWSPDGAKVLTASEDKTARIWDATTGKQLTELSGHTSRVCAAAWSPDGSKVVTASWDKTARVWDAKTGAKIVELKGHTQRVYTAAFNRDGSKVLTAGEDFTARLWDAATGQTLTELKGHTDEIVCASFSRDDSLILTASKDRTARVWTPDGKLLNELRGHEDEITSASFNRDGSKVLTASRDKTARIWNTLRNTTVTELAGHADMVTVASWNPDGSKLVTASYRSPGQIWDATTGGKLAQLRAQRILHAVWSRDGTKLATAGGDEPPSVWDTSTGQRMASFAGRQGSVQSLAWNSDGSKVLTTATATHARIWNAPVGNLLVEVEGEPGEKGDKYTARGATFSPDDTKILAYCVRVARVWDAATGKRLVEFKGHTEPIRIATWSPDGTKVVTGAMDNTARVWHATTGKQLHLLKGHTYGVSQAIWSADGTRVLTAGWDGTPRLWDTTTGKILVEFTGHTAGITSLDWLAKESRVLTSGLDQTLRIWDAQSGAELLALPASGILIQPPIVSPAPDGTRILTRGTNRQTAIIYDARPVNRAFVR